MAADDDGRARRWPRRAALGLPIAAALAFCLRRARAQATDGAPAAAPGDRAAFAARAAANRERSIRAGDQPYGAVVVRNGAVVGDGVSAVVTAGDPTAHAERQALRDAMRRLGSADLAGCDLYGTSRACPECEAAAHRAGIRRMYVGADATDAGAPRDRSSGAVAAPAAIPL